MKYRSILIFLSFGLLHENVQGQSSSELPRYDYSKQPDADYNQLPSGAVVFSLPDDWDDEQSDAVDIPFPFYYQNVLVGNIKAIGNGSLMLNGAINPNAELGNTVGLSMDYASKSRGTVLYEVTGSTPHQVFKVEYRNIGLYDDVLNMDSLNFQIWLYEGSNAINIEQDIQMYRILSSLKPHTIFFSNRKKSCIWAFFKTVEICCPKILTVYIFTA